MQEIKWCLTCIVLRRILQKMNPSNSKYFWKSLKHLNIVILCTNPIALIQKKPTYWIPTLINTLIKLFHWYFHYHLMMEVCTHALFAQLRKSNICWTLERLMHFCSHVEAYCLCYTTPSHWIIQLSNPHWSTPKGLVVPTPKWPAAKSPSDFRPISVLSVLSKVLIEAFSHTHIWPSCWTSSTIK